MPRDWKNDQKNIEMSPDALQQSVRWLRDYAFGIRKARIVLAREVPTLSPSVTDRMRGAAQQLDDAADNLLLTYGESLPEGVL